MDASDMGLPDDELYKKLTKLAQEGFNFDDLLEAEAERGLLMEEMSEAIDRYDRGPFKGMKLPHVQLRPEEIPEFVDHLITSGFHHPGLSASLMIRLTNTVRALQSGRAKQKVCELIEAMVESEEDFM